MVGSIAEALSISTTAVWVLFAVIAVQLAVQIWALVDLSGRPRVLHDKKWLWALVIIFFGNWFVGPILYVVLGRRVPQQAGSESTPASGASLIESDRTRRAVDSLYDERGGE